MSKTVIVRVPQVKVVTAGKNFFPSGMIATQPVTFYVSPGGSDLNDGKSASNPWQSIQKAVDAAAALMNNGHDITVQLLDGVYTTTGIYLPAAAQGCGKLTLQGNETNAASVEIISSSFCISTKDGAIWTVRKMKLSSTGNGNACMVGGYNNFNGRGEMTVDDVIFGACNQYLFVNGKRSKIIAMTTLTVVGAGARAMQLEGGAEIRLGATITFDAPGATITHSVLVNDLSLLIAFGSCVVTPTTTVVNSNGSRCRVRNNSVAHIFTGAGLSYFPGPDAVQLTNGGIYFF